MASPTQWTQVWANSGRMVKDREAWRAAVRGIAQLDTTGWLNNNSNNKHLGIRFTTFPALLWVESESNYSTSSKNDGITDKNKHYHKSFLKILEETTQNRMQAWITGYLLNQFVTTWLVYIWSFSSHGFHFARTPEDSDTEEWPPSCCVPTSVVFLWYKQKILEVWSLLVFAGVGLGERWVVGGVWRKPT